MRIVACVNAIRLSQYASLYLADGETAIGRVAQSLAMVVDEVVALTTADSADLLPDGWRREVAEDWHQRRLLEAMKRIGAGWDALLYVYADTPFVDVDLARRLIDVHRRYLAEYSFADGYPGGVSPEIIATETIDRLLGLCREEPIKRSALFDVIQRNINAFDIETELSPVDLRPLRLLLACDTRRNFVLCRRLAEAGVRGEQALLNTLQRRPELLRSLPAYFSIEIVARHSQRVSNSPAHLLRRRNDGRIEMPIADLLHIRDGIEALASDAMVHISTWGEAGLHSQIVEALRLFAGRPDLQLLVETSGVGWAPEVLEEICAGAFGWPTWIVALDTEDPDLYHRLRGEGYEESRRFVEALMAAYPQQVYVQATRTKESEPHLEHFYRHWKERTQHIIIQKYDHYCGRLEDKRPTDISPVDRNPCWHIMRDMTILIDGQVPLCREDLAIEHSLGNILREDPTSIWERGKAFYLRHLTRDYPALCRGCDEYYTYNN